jgi:WD40 repeat protein
MCACLVQTNAPVAIINGHSKAVSYVRWMGTTGLVSASTDNTLKLWDVDDVLSGQRVEPITTFTGDAHSDLTYCM